MKPKFWQMPPPDQTAPARLPEKIRLLRSFDPSSPRGADVDDPYYSNAAAFTEVRAQIDAAMPGMIDWVKERLEHSSRR